MSYLTELNEKLIKAEEGNALPPEAVIKNLQSSLQAMTKENAQLEQELKIARSDNADLKEAIAAAFVEKYRYGGGRA